MSSVFGYIQNIICLNYVIIISVMSDTILITGSKGFFGKELVSRIKPTNFKIKEIDLEDGKNYVSLTEKDLKDVKYVVHLANSARIMPSWKQPAHYYTNNLSDTTNFFINCQNAGVEKFLYFSSSSVYGNNGEDIQSEEQPLCPTNPYALSKMSAEMSLKMFADKTKLIIARPFTMYGTTMPLVHNALVIGKFIHAYKNNKPLTIDGTGDQKRDFISVDDAVDAVLLLLELANTGTYNIGTGKSISIKDLADLFEHKTLFGPNRRGVEYDTCAEISKLRELGFNPQTNVMTWILEHKNNNFEELKCH